jgi:hypothetical protein
MRTQTLLLALALPLAACGDKPDDTGDGDTGDTGGGGGVYAGLVGQVHACVGGDAPDPYSGEVNSFWDADVSGTVVSDGPMSGELETDFYCEGTPARVLVVEDAGGAQWQFTYGVVDAAGTDATPALAVAAGDSVMVRYRAVLDFGQANGWVATDADGAAIGAFEAGTWGNALQEGDVPGLVVTAGVPIAEINTECGPRIYDFLTFTGDDSVQIEPFGTGSVTVGGQALTAFGVAATHFDERVQCTDLAGVTSWAVAR